MQDPVREGPTIDGVQRSCSSENEPAACCRQTGNGCSSANLNWCNGVGSSIECTACTSDGGGAPTTAKVGRFVAVGWEMSITEAINWCEQNYMSLASIHSYEEQQQASSACMAYADAEAQLQSDGGNHLYGCWIGFQDVGMEGAFSWLDGSSVDYVDFAPGEPNDSHAGENAGSGQAGRETEDAVEMDFRRNIGRLGEWNDAQSDEGYEQFPICETHIPPPTPGAPYQWGLAQSSSFRIRVCIDHIDDIYFQDDRFWIAYDPLHNTSFVHPFLLAI